MCKNHDQAHYQPAMREVAAIIAGSGYDETRDLLLRRATCEGLSWAATRLHRFLSPAELVRVRSRVEAERAAIGQMASARLTEQLTAVLAEPYDEPPF